MTYPIAELFDSIQGEGIHTGLRMFFIRFAGCNVGRYTILDSPLQIIQQANPRYSICRSALGNEFLCDTDYHGIGQYSVEQLLDGLPAGVRHVCLTGGEPLIHNIRPLVDALHSKGLHVHLETSGTKLIEGNGLHTNIHSQDWIACSPKYGFLEDNRDIIDEYKFVVDPSMVRLDVVNRIRDVVGDDYLTPIFIQPANWIDKVDERSLAFARSIVQRSAEYRLSIQLHKVLGVR